MSLVPWPDGVTHAWAAHRQWGRLLLLEAEGSPLSLSRMEGAQAGEVQGAISSPARCHRQRSRGRGEGAGRLRDTVPGSPLCQPGKHPKSCSRHVRALGDDGQDTGAGSTCGYLASLDGLPWGPHTGSFRVWAVKGRKVRTSEEQQPH